MKAPRRQLRQARPAQRRSVAEQQIERLIRAGADPEQFVCADCSTWVLEVWYCGCWERAAF